MPCRRCAGLLLDEDDCQRCVNCGHREFDEGEPMPRFKDEESRQRWLAALRAVKAKQVARRQAHEDQPEESVARAVTVSPVAGVVVPTLDDKIAQMTAELAVLEQAREILSRA